MVKRSLRTGDEGNAVGRKRTRRMLQCDEIHTSIGQDIDSSSEEGEAGLIEKVVLKNFMCHLHLEFEFGPHVNFISGRNGTGKSAVLYGIIFALGGKVSGKNNTLSSYIHYGKTCAEVSVTLRNTGSDAYQPEKYGARIIVERRIPKDSSSTYKIKGDRGKLVSVTHEELNNILEALNIQIDNPVSILSQDASKNFLNSTDAKKKYEFFFKGTQLEKLHARYTGAKIGNEQAECTLQCKKMHLIDIEKEVKKCQDTVRQYENVSKQEQNIKKLENELSWALAIEMKKLQDNAMKERDNFKAKLEQLESNLQTTTRKFHEHIDKLRIQNTETRRKKDEQEKCRSAEMEAAHLYNERNEEIREQRKYIQRMSRAINIVSDQIDEAQTILRQKKDNAERNTEDAKAKRVSEISSLEVELKACDSKLSVLDKEVNDLKEKQKDLQKNNLQLKESIRLLEQDIKDREEHLKLMEKSLASNSKLAKFGAKMQALVEEINRNANLFIKKPFGPLGVYISVVDPKWVDATEVCLKSLLYSFCCDNMKDLKTLQGLMKRILKDQKHPSIIIRKFLDKVHEDVHVYKVISEYKTVLDVISCNEPVVMNCLIDQCSIESIVLIESSSKASEVMMRNRLKNCKAAFTKNGDELYPNPKYRYYSCNYRPTSLLRSQGHTKADIEIKRAEITGLKNTLKEKKSSKHSALELGKLTSELIQKNAEKSPWTKKKLEINNRVKELNVQDEPFDISAQEYELKTLLAWKDRLVGEKQEMEKECDEAKENLSSLRQKHTTKNEQLQKKKEEIDKLLSVIQELETEKHKLEEKCKKLEDFIKQKRQDLPHWEEKLKSATDEATKTFAEASSLSARIDTVRTPFEVDTELKNLKNAMKEFYSSRIDRENARRQFKEKSEKLCIMRKEVSLAERMITKLQEMIMARMRKYVEIRTSVTMPVQIMFLANMALKEYDGHLIFDHESKHLLIENNSEKGPSSNRCKTGYLSGGEKSYTTVAFLLALYDVTEMPFHILDEYDVYMDALNRDVSMKFMLDLATSKKKAQFIFLSPLDLPSGLGPSVQIHRMPDVVRGQKET